MKIKLLVVSILAFFSQRKNKTITMTDDNLDLKMDISKGFQIDNPNILVSWDIDEKILIDLFQGNKLKHVTTGYYTTNCTSLNGLNCMIGFHFEPRKNGKLKELEFFRESYSNQQESFDNFQTHFENSFGKPNNSSKGNDGFNNYSWRINNIQIFHYVYDRFGSEEHMGIKIL